MRTLGKVNVATSFRQPGSVFKSIIYAAGLEKRIMTPATVLKDEAKIFKNGGGLEYKPKNYDGKFRGDVLVRRVLANSLNVPAVEVMEKFLAGTPIEKFEQPENVVKKKLYSTKT